MGYQHQIAQQFLAAVFGEVPSQYHWLLWRLPPRVSWWGQGGASDEEVIDAGCAWAQAAVEDRANVYCGIGLSDCDRGAANRVRNEDCAGLVGLVADVDFRAPDKSKPYPSDASVAWELLLETGLHPTIILNSGHGLQAWWLFKEAWTFDSPEERQKAILLSRSWGLTIQELANRKGAYVDSVHDVARVMRVAGTTNFKDPGNPRPVELVFIDECRRYSDHEFEEQLLVFAEPETDRAQVQLPAHPEANDAFPWDKHDVLLGNSEEYRGSWNRTRRDIKDKSASGWDMSLAYLCVQAGFTDAEVCAVLVASRRKHGDKIKPTSYYGLTIAKARSSAGEQAEIPGADVPREERLEQIGADLGIPLADVQRITGETAVYRFIMRPNGDATGRERSVELAAPALLQQTQFRAQMFNLTGIAPRKIASNAHPGWDDYVNAISAVAEELDIGEDATAQGELRSMLTEFFASNRPIELEPGTPITEPGAPFYREGRVWFQLSALYRYVTTIMNARITQQLLLQRLAVLGAHKRTMAVRKPGGARTTGHFYGVPWKSDDDYCSEGEDD